MDQPTQSVVTGASQGLGASVARRLAGEGHRVFALARSTAKLESLAASADGVRGEIVPLVCDVSDSGAVAETIAAIDLQAGRIDVLVNNAGVFEAGLMYEQPLDAIDTMVDTNLKGLMYVTHEVVPIMLRHGSGRIIHVASVAGTAGLEKSSIYCATKHGVRGFSHAVARDLIDKGILVTALCPGGTDTPLWESDSVQAFEQSSRHRELMQPDDIADMISYILRMPPKMLFKDAVFFPTMEWF